MSPRQVQPPAASAPRAAPAFPPSRPLTAPPPRPLRTPRRRRPAVRGDGRLRCGRFLDHHRGLGRFGRRRGLLRRCARLARLAWARGLRRLGRRLLEWAQLPLPPPAPVQPPPPSPARAPLRARPEVPPPRPGSPRPAPAPRRQRLLEDHTRLGLALGLERGGLRLHLDDLRRCRSSGPAAISAGSTSPASTPSPSSSPSNSL